MNECLPVFVDMIVYCTITQNFLACEKYSASNECEGIKKTLGECAAENKFIITFLFLKDDNKG